MKFRKQKWKELELKRYVYVRVCAPVCALIDELIFFLKLHNSLRHGYLWGEVRGSQGWGKGDVSFYVFCIV